MRRANIISGGCLVVFALVMLFAVIPWQIPQGPPGIMSPRLVPTLSMSVIVLLSGLLIVVNARGRADETSDAVISSSEYRALGKIAALFLAGLLIFYAVGPLAASIVLIAGGLLVLGERRPLVLAGLPLALIGAVYLLFYQVLGTSIL